MEDLPLPVQALLSGALGEARPHSRYAGGWKYCPECREWFKTDGTRCPACRGRLRTRSRDGGGGFTVKRVDPLKYGVDPEEI